MEYFFPKTVKTKAMLHGKIKEEEAREEYEKFENVSVVTCGAIISKLNPWLSYSPDGIVMKDEKPHTLLEIKCPFSGKNQNIVEVLPKIKYLNVKNGVYF